MTRTFIQTKEFTKNWDKLGFSDKDLRMLELELLNNSSMFPVIKGTGGVRKMRFSFENEGKSGGVRGLYVCFVFEETIYFITVYAKRGKNNFLYSWRDGNKKNK